MSMIVSIRYVAVMVVISLLAIGACTRRETTMLVPAVRFVDGAATGGDVPRGTMADHHRYVLPLRSDGFVATFERADVAIPPGARLAFALGASFRMPGGDRAVTFELNVCAAAACETVLEERIDFAVQAAPTWLERELTLEQYAGTSRRFVFRALTTSLAARAFWANPTILVPASRPPDAHNVILVSLDTLRAARLPSYGYAHDTAPFLDETFARNGTVFDQCVSAATTTTPSHMTMFTSLPPSVHGIGLTTVKPLVTTVPTVPELMRAAGFKTGAITENGWVTFVQGFGRGFDTYLENKGPNTMEPKGQADVTFRSAGEWIRQHRDERFFLFLHTYQVHKPYVPPPEYAALFADQPGIPAHFSRDAANYDREIRFTDDMLREFFGTLRELGLDRHTIVLVTSDHGEEFGEHGCEQHGEQLYEEVSHVPLMLWGPGIPRGRRIAEPVGLIDVTPTLLGLAGLPSPEHAMGVSLVPALTSGHAPADRYLFTESWSVGVCIGKSFERPGFAVRSREWKLARYRRDGSVAYELYDLVADPAERMDLGTAEPSKAAALRRLVDEYEETCRARAAALFIPPEDGSGAGNAPLDARQREKLRALGYVE